MAENVAEVEKIFSNLWENNPIFRDNIAVLSQLPLRNLPVQIFPEFLKRAEESFRYIPPPPPEDKKLHILNIEDTVDLLLENPKSFCRFGDGEISIMSKQSHAFQDYDENLAQRMREILQSSSDKCYVCIDDHYFNLSDKLPEKTKLFIYQFGYDIRQQLLKYCNRKRLYLASAFTCIYFNSIRTRQESQIYYDKIKNLFRGRNLCIFSGKTVFNNASCDVFEYAASRTHIFCDSHNAWRQYEEILATARKFPKDKVTLCFILGQTATVAAWDLAHEGYMAWDIGHIAKDYDAFVQEKDSSFMDSFFAPD